MCFLLSSYWAAVSGLWKEAIASFRKAVAASGRSPGYIASLAHACAVAGKHTEVLELMQELKRLAGKRYVSPYCFALVEAGMGNRDTAFAWFAKAYQERSGALPFVKVNPRLASLHSDRRFHSFVRRLGLGK
jgi:hypothetical protein